MGGYEGLEEQVDFGGNSTEGLLGLESLTLDEVSGGGDGVGLYHFHTTKSAFDTLRGEVNSLTTIIGDVVAAVESLRQQRAGHGPPAAAAATTLGGISGPDVVQLERRLEAHIKALIDLAATRLQSKAVHCGAESFGDVTEAHQFVLTETVQSGCEAWMGAVYLMISAETDTKRTDNRPLAKHRLHSHVKGTVRRISIRWH